MLTWYYGDRGEQSMTGTELAVLTLLLFLGAGVFLGRPGRRSGRGTAIMPWAPSTTMV